MKSSLKLLKSSSSRRPFVPVTAFTLASIVSLTSVVAGRTLDAQPRSTAVSAPTSNGSWAAPRGARPETTATRPLAGDGWRGQTPDRSASDEAVIDAATREYREKGIARPVALGQFVAFPFGHSQPVLTCTVLRACVIELEPGETIVNEPIAGDHVRWVISPAAAGPGGRNALVVVKPKDCELTTNLVIPTDRRIYDLTLDSPPCRSRVSGGSGTNPQQPYVRHVRFYYPDEPSGQRFVRSAPAPAAPARPRVEELNYDYRITRDGHFPWRPKRVFDDGTHIYLQLPTEAATGALPALFVLNEDGTQSVLNYAVYEDDGVTTYVTDRVFRRGMLMMGESGRETWLGLENRAWGKTPDRKGRR